MDNFNDEHDYDAFPELTNAQIAEIGISSPHEQIQHNFRAVVIRVHDGDTVTLRCDFRDFDFPLRLSDIDAPELNTGVPGQEARDYLKGVIEGEEVDIVIDYNNRVDKYGRLLGNIVIGGQDMSEVMMIMGFAKPFENRYEEDIPDFEKQLGEYKKWH